jgi:hypothetical protein
VPPTHILGRRRPKGKLPAKRRCRQVCKASRSEAFPLRSCVVLDVVHAARPTSGLGVQHFVTFKGRLLPPSRVKVAVLL